MAFWMLFFGGGGHRMQTSPQLSSILCPAPHMPATATMCCPVAATQPWCISAALTKGSCCQVECSAAQNTSSIALLHCLAQVALYAPPSADPTKVVPIAWVAVADSNPDYTKTGSGKVV